MWKNSENIFDIDEDEDNKEHPNSLFVENRNIIEKSKKQSNDLR